MNDPEEIQKSLEISSEAIAKIQKERLAKIETWNQIIAERQKQEMESHKKEIADLTALQAARNAAPICQNCGFRCDIDCHAVLPVASGPAPSGASTGKRPVWPKVDLSWRCSLFERKEDHQKRSCKTCRHWQERFPDFGWPIKANPGIRNCCAVPRNHAAFPVMNADDFCGQWEPITTDKE